MLSDTRRPAKALSNSNGMNADPHPTPPAAPLSSNGRRGGKLLAVLRVRFAPPHLPPHSLLLLPCPFASFIPANDEPLAMPSGGSGVPMCGPAPASSASGPARNPAAVVPGGTRAAAWLRWVRPERPLSTATGEEAPPAGMEGWLSGLLLAVLFRWRLACAGQSRSRGGGLLGE